MSRHRPWYALVVAAACASGRGAPVPAPAAAATPRAPRDSIVDALQRQVANGSIIADVQLGRTEPMAIGACLDPVAAARFELDRSLEIMPDEPPVPLSGIVLPPLPPSLRDSAVRTGIVTARWVIDTAGTTIPASVTIVSSPHGLMSAQVCVAVFGTRFKPAKENGRLVRARVEMPVRFVR
jgi:hypothetical protein